MIRKYALPLLAMVGFGIAIVAAIHGDRDGAATLAQTSSPSGNAPFSSYIFGPGIIEAGSENIAIGTPVPGIVSAVYAKWGDRVRSGAPLFKIDTRDLEAQLVPSNAKIKEVESQLSLAKAKVAEAQATLAKAENRLQVGQGLEPGISISVEELSNRKFDVGIDQAAVNSAAAEVEQIQAQIGSAEAQVEQIEQEIARRTIRAPVPGRILQMNTRLGEYAQSGGSTPLMLLGDDTRLHLRVDVDETDAWRFKPCAPAIAVMRGNQEIKAPLQYVRTDPDVIPKSLFTGDTTQRTDTRVLQVIYSFEPRSSPFYVGELMDVFIQAAPLTGNSADSEIPARPCTDSSSSLPNPASGGRGRP